MVGEVAGNAASDGGTGDFDQSNQPENLADLTAAEKVRGETYHFELVANEAGAGVTRVSLDHQIPIANAILTTEDMPQAIARQVEKGRDAAQVAVEMANLLESI